MVVKVSQVLAASHLATRGAGATDIHARYIGDGVGVSQTKQEAWLRLKHPVNPLKKSPLLGGIASFLVVGSLLGCAEEAPSLNEQAATLLSESVLTDKHYPFMTAYVESARGDVLVSTEVASEAFFTPRTAPTVDDWMRIWSMSKLVTIVLALDLAEDGLIALDDEVSSYLPEVGTLKVARPKGPAVTYLLRAQAQSRAR